MVGAAVGLAVLALTNTNSSGSRSNRTWSSCTATTLSKWVKLPAGRSRTCSWLAASHSSASMPSKRSCVDPIRVNR